MWQNEHFRAQYKAEHPDEPAKAVATAAGPVWKAMSAEEKEPWQAKYKAAQAEYHAATGKSDSPKAVVAVSSEASEPEETKEEKKARKEAKKAEKAAKKAAKAAKKAEKEAKNTELEQVLSGAVGEENPTELLAEPVSSDSE